MNSTSTSASASIPTVIGNALKDWTFSLQDYSLLTWHSIRKMFAASAYFTDLVEQMDQIGVGSALIVVAALFCVGGVVVLNAAAQFARFGETVLTGNAVSLALVRELGPVFTALLVAGRNASGIASELGSMKVTEQIDAMRALGTDPIQKLVTPRMIATCVMLPMLTIVADFVGLLGGYVIAYYTIGITTSQYWTDAYQALAYNDVVQGLLKPFVFAFIISLVGCFYGLRTSGGTQGVGLATTKAVVVSSIWVFVVTSMLTRIFVNLH